MPTRLIGCSARDARVLHVEDRDLHRRCAARPPYSRGQWMPTQRAAASSRLPAPPELDLVGDGLESRRHLDVVGEPRTDLGRERLLLGA